MFSFFMCSLGLSNRKAHIKCQGYIHISITVTIIYKLPSHLRGCPSRCLNRPGTIKNSIHVSSPLQKKVSWAGFLIVSVLVALVSHTSFQIPGIGINFLVRVHRYIIIELTIIVGKYHWQLMQPQS